MGEFVIGVEGLLKCARMGIRASRGCILSFAPPWLACRCSWPSPTLARKHLSVSTALLIMHCSHPTSSQCKISSTLCILKHTPSLKRTRSFRNINRDFLENVGGDWGLGVDTFCIMGPYLAAKVVVCLFVCLDVELVGWSAVCLVVLFFIFRLTWHVCVSTLGTDVVSAAPWHTKGPALHYLLATGSTHLNLNHLKSNHFNYFLPKRAALHYPLATFKHLNYLLAQWLTKGHALHYLLHEDSTHLNI